MTTFLYTLTGGHENMKKKISFKKCIQKSNVILKNWVLVFSFMYLVLVDAMDKSKVTKGPFWMTAWDKSCHLGAKLSKRKQT